MNRRTFLCGLTLGTLAVPLAAEAQQPGRIYRLGCLSRGSLALTKPALEEFRQGLRELGYVEGHNLTIERRYASGRYDRLPDLAAELVRLRVDVIFTSWGTPSALAAKRATQTIPVVFTGVGDAIGVGFVSSLARPRGNITGLTLVSQDTVGKQLQLLKEAVPRLARVAVFSNPTNPVYGPVLKDIDVMGRALGVQIERIGVQDQREFEPALDAAERRRCGGLVLLRDPVFFMNKERLLAAVQRRGLPAMWGLRELVDAGGLMSYGPNLFEMYRRAALYVDRVLRGAKPGDLPVEQADRFELVINLKTAKALGLTIPRSLLLRGDQVIE